MSSWQSSNKGYLPPWILRKWKILHKTISRPYVQHQQRTSTKIYQNPITTVTCYREKFCFNRKESSTFTTEEGKNMSVTEIQINIEYKKPLKPVWPDCCKAATYTEKTKAENVYVTLKLEMFTFSVRNTGCKRKYKLKSISVCVHWSAKSRSRSINFVLVGRNSSMPTNLPSKAHVINGVKESKLKSISVCVHWSAKSRSINFVLVRRNSSMPTNLPSKVYMWLMMWKRAS